METREKIYFGVFGCWDAVADYYNSLIFWYSVCLPSYIYTVFNTEIAVSTFDRSTPMPFRVGYPVFEAMERCVSAPVRVLTVCRSCSHPGKTSSIDFWEVGNLLTGHNATASGSPVVTSRLHCYTLNNAVLYCTRFRVIVLRVHRCLGSRWYPSMYMK